MKSRPLNSALQAWVERCIRNDWAIRQARARFQSASDELFELKKTHEALMAELEGLLSERRPELLADLHPEFRKAGTVLAVSPSKK